MKLDSTIMPNKRLGGKTPAQAVGKKLPYCHDMLKLMMKFISTALSLGF
jgi:hypothetical protein